MGFYGEFIAFFSAVFATMRICLIIEYDGTHFHGWQSQPSKNTVQDYLNSALAKIANHAVSSVAAGRTDAGVHALSQVVHFDTQTERPMSAWVRGVNAHLPASIRVQTAQLVNADFHARFDAFQRSYQYLLVNSAVAPAILASKAGWYHLPLDIMAMQEAMHFLVGQHDFSAFRASGCQAKSPVKTMHKSTVKQYGDCYLFEFTANAFLHHQVRNMIGALIYVGNGKQPPQHIKHLLMQQDRTISPPTFSPAGLYLTGVGYDAKWGLPVIERHLSLALTQS